MRFVSSGTEAVMSAIRLARAFTGRDLIVKFSGCYHGHADHLLVAAGSGLATFGRPSSAGVPEAFTACTRVLPLDDEAAVEELFADEGARIAAVIIEPVPANHGLLLQRREFLQALRADHEQHGALLIFDEVISGFRLARGGVAELTRHRSRPGDLRQGYRRRHAGRRLRRPARDHGAPGADGDTYQAGTLSGNPVAMASGIATLDVLIKQNGWQQLEALGAELEKLLAPVLATAPFPGAPGPRRLALLAVVARGRRAAHGGALERARRRSASARCSMPCLRRGVYLPPSAYEACFLSLAHTSADLQRFAQALRESLAAIAERRRHRHESHARLPAHRPRAGGRRRRAGRAGGCSTSSTNAIEKVREERALCTRSRSRPRRRCWMPVCPPERVRQLLPGVASTGGTRALSIRQWSRRCSRERTGASINMPGRAASSCSRSAPASP